MFSAGSGHHQVTSGPPGSPPFVIFYALCFMTFIASGFVLFRLFLSWFFLGPCYFGSLFIRFVDIIKAYIYVL